VAADKDFFLCSLAATACCFHAGAPALDVLALFVAYEGLSSPSCGVEEFGAELPSLLSWPPSPPLPASSSSLSSSSSATMEADLDFLYSSCFTPSPSAASRLRSLEPAPVVLSPAVSSACCATDSALSRLLRLFETVVPLRPGVLDGPVWDAEDEDMDPRRFDEEPPPPREVPPCPASDSFRPADPPCLCLERPCPGPCSCPCLGALSISPPPTPVPSPAPEIPVSTSCAFLNLPTSPLSNSTLKNP